MFKRPLSFTALTSREPVFMQNQIHSANIGRKEGARISKVRVSNTSHRDRGMVQFRDGKVYNVEVELQLREAYRACCSSHKGLIEARGEDDNLFEKLHEELKDTTRHSAHGCVRFLKGHTRFSRIAYSLYQLDSPTEDNAFEEPEEAPLSAYDIAVEPQLRQVKARVQKHAQAVADEYQARKSFRDDFRILRELLRRHGTRHNVIYPLLRFEHDLEWFTHCCNTVKKAYKEHKPRALAYLREMADDAVQSIEFFSNELREYHERTLSDQRRQYDGYRHLRQFTAGHHVLRFADHRRWHNSFKANLLTLHLVLERLKMFTADEDFYSRYDLEMSEIMTRHQHTAHTFQNNAFMDMIMQMQDKRDDYNAQLARLEAHVQRHYNKCMEYNERLAVLVSSVERDSISL